MGYACAHPVPAIRGRVATSLTPISAATRHIERLYSSMDLPAVLRIRTIGYVYCWKGRFVHYWLRLKIAPLGGRLPRLPVECCLPRFFELADFCVNDRLCVCIFYYQCLYVCCAANLAEGHIQHQFGECVIFLRLDLDYIS